jgi:hypothetical protein
MLRLSIGLSMVVTLLAILLGYSPPVATPNIQRGAPLAIVRPTPAPLAIDTVEESALLGADNFARAATDSWPAASKGGDYTLLGPAADFGVGLGAGLIRTPSGAARAATLLGVNARDVDVRTRIVTDRAADTGDQFAFVVIRRIDEATNYQGRVRFDAAHSAWLQAARTVHGSTEMLGEETLVPDYTHSPASALWLRAAAAGDAPTELRLKAWPDGQPEPETWQYAANDSDASLGAPGAVALQTYVSARETNGPVTFRFSDLRVVAATPETLLAAPLNLPPPTPTPRPTEPPSTPTVVVAPTRVPPTATPTAEPPTSTQVWAGLQGELDALWGRDTERSIALLDGFIARFPDHETAREKLYAALIARAHDLVLDDDPEHAVEQLERAEALFPARGEAPAALALLTPTPVPVREQPVVQPVVPAAPRPVTSAPPPAAPRPAPARPAPPPPPPPPPPAQPVVVQRPAPTPTKVPFVVPPRSVP